MVCELLGEEEERISGISMLGPVFVEEMCLGGNKLDGFVYPGVRGASMNK